MKLAFLTALIAAGSALATSATYAQTMPCAPYAILSQIMAEGGMALEASPMVDMRNGTYGRAEVWVDPQGR